MWLVFTLAVLVLLESFIGIEMVNTPPKTKRQKWFWRIAFFTLAIAIISLTCLQNFYSEKNEQQMRVDFGDRLDKLGGNVDKEKSELSVKIGDVDSKLATVNSLQQRYENLVDKVLSNPSYSQEVRRAIIEDDKTNAEALGVQLGDLNAWQAAIRAKIRDKRASDQIEHEKWLKEKQSEYLKGF